jgi:hypothetical protein
MNAFTPNWPLIGALFLNLMLWYGILMLVLPMGG